MALTRITKGVIKPNENYDTHNINSTGIVTAIGLDVNGNGDISGNLNVGGVLTYEDVTSIDSVGIITAQKDIHVGAGISAVGIGTFGGLDINGDIDVDGHTNLDNGNVAGIVTFNSGSALHMNGGQLLLFDRPDGNSNNLFFGTGGRAVAYHDGTGFSLTNNVGHAYIGVGVGSKDLYLYAQASGNVLLQQNTGVRYVKGVGSDASVQLFFNNNLRLNTTDAGVSIPKDLDVDGHTNLDNVSISGITTITSIGPSIHFTDTNHNSDYSIVVNSGQFRIRDESNSANRFYIASDGSNFLNGDVHLGENQFGTGSRTRVYSGGGTHVKNALMVTNPTASVTGRGAGVALCAIGSTNDYIGTLYVRRSALGDNRGTTYLEAKDDIIINTNAATSTVTAATFDTSGRLMVGTSAVGRSGAQNLTIGNTGDQGMTIRSGTSHEGNIYFSDGSSGGNEESRGIFRFDHSNDSFQFYTASGNNFSQERLRITSDGKVRIANTDLTTSSKADNLIVGTTSGHTGITIFSGTGETGNIYFGDTDTGGVENRMGTITYDHSGNYMRFSTSGNQERLRITSAGLVGINTTNPSTYLMISGAGNQRQDMLRLQHEGQRNFYIQGQWGSTDIGGSNGILQYTDGGGIGFRSGATGAAGLTVSNGNKVGIHTSDPSVNLHAFHSYTTNASVSWGANCGQIFRNEGSELAFGLQNTNPYPYYIQARHSSSGARQLAINPRGGAVSVNTINSFSRAFTVNGQVGVISPNQTAAMDMVIDDSGNFEIGAYHPSNGGSLTLKTAPAGLGNQTRLNINKDGQLTHTTNKSSEYTARFVQAHADNPAWIEIDSPQDNNLRPAYIQFKNAGNNKWGIGQVYNPTAGQSFHICEGTQSNSNSHFVIKSNNYVGINTNNPQSALHVRGGGGIRIDTLSGTPIASSSNVITDGGGNPIISGTPWFMTDTFAWQGSYSGMRYYWIKVVKSLGSSAIGYIDYMAHGDSNYPRHLRGTIGIAKYANGSISCCHDQQTHEPGTVNVVLCGDGTVWMRLANYDWNSDFRFRLVYGESVTLNTDFTITGNSDNSYGRIDPGGGGSPVNSSNDILPGANVRYSVSSNSFNPSSSNSTYSGDTHRFFKIDVANQLIKGSGSFRIDHPLAGMSTSHYLQHSFVEGPQADNIYRGKTTLVAGISTVNIDTVSNMTDGTFVKLNTDVQCFTTNETGWTPIKGTVSGNKLTILAQDNSCTDTISWMVVGERQDDNIKNKADWTDSDGKVIVELPKQNVGYAGTEAPYDEFK